MSVRRSLMLLITMILAGLVSTALAVPPAVGADDETPISELVDPATGELLFGASFAAPLADPSDLGDPAETGVLLPELSTERSNSYQMPDGSVSVQGFLEPVNYREDTGGWVPIDNTLVPAPGAAYEVENAEAGFEVQIPADAGSTPVKVSVEDFWVTMKLRGMDGAPSVEDATATFDQVPNADSVELEATNTGLKESIILTEPPAGSGPLTYVYDIGASGGITPVLVDDVGLRFVNSSGKVMATIPIGLMWDSAEPSAEADTGQYQLAPSASGWTLTLSPDIAWLRDPSRVYPVVVDPSIVTTANYDCKLHSAFPTANHCGQLNDKLLIGRQDANTKWRALLNFGITPPTGSRLSGAALSLIQRPSETVGTTTYAAYTPSRTFNTNATWNASGTGSWTGGSPGAPASAGVSVGPSGIAVQRWFDVTSVVAEWFKPAPNYRGIVVAAVNEENKNTSFYSTSNSTPYTEWKPTLIANYYAAPRGVWTQTDCASAGLSNGAGTLQLFNDNEVDNDVLVAMNGQYQALRVPANGSVTFTYAGLAAGSYDIAMAFYAPASTNAWLYNQPVAACAAPTLSATADRCVDDTEANAHILVNVTNPNPNPSTATVNVAGQSQTEVIAAQATTTFDFAGIGAGTYPGSVTFGPPVVTSASFNVTVQSCSSQPPPVGPGDNDAGERSFWQFHESTLTDRITAKVNVGNGNLLLQAQDITVAGVAGWDMAMTRYYNSALAVGSGPNATIGNMGKGWTTAFGGSVRIEHLANGDEAFYGPSAYRTEFKDIDPQANTVKYTRVKPGIKADLTKLANGNYELKWHDKGMYLFDSTGRLASTEDKNGNKLQFGYNGTGKVNAITDTRNRVARVSYNSDGLVESVWINKPGETDVADAMVRWDYTYLNGRLATTKLAAINSTKVGNTYASPTNDPTVGALTTYEYDTNGYLNKITDAREVATGTGGVTTIGYNTQGRVSNVSRLTQSDPAPDSTTTFKYYTAEAASKTCSQADINDNDAKARTNVNGPRADNPEKDDVTRYCIDGVGRVLRTRDANDHVRSQTWDPNSNVLTADAQGLGSGVDQFEYTYSNDNQTRVDTPEGAVATATYDTAGSSDHSADKVNTDYSETNGQDTDTSNDEPKTSWDYDYDNKNNLIRAKSPNGTGAKDPNVDYFYCWTPKGQILRIDPVTATGTAANSTDPQNNGDCNADATQGNDTLFTYSTDGLHNLERVDRPEGGDQWFTYDGLSRLDTVRDGRDVTITYKYDGLDRVVQAAYTKPGETTQVINWGYDLAGNMITLGDLNSPNPNTFGYDELNRKHTESAQGVVGGTTYDYDPTSNLKKVTTSIGSTTYTTTYDNYDPVNLLTQMTVRATNGSTTVLAAQKFTFGYDKKDHRTRTSFHGNGEDNPATVIQAARYNRDGNITCVFSYRTSSPPPGIGDDQCPTANRDELITFYGYDYTRFGITTPMKWAMTERGGNKTDYDYDRINRLVNAKTKPANAGGNTPALRTFDYGYDRHSNLTRETVSGTTPGLTVGTQRAAFNAGDEICRTLRTAGVDPNPNLTCTTNTSGSTQFTHDGAGNLRTATGGTTATLNGLDLSYNLPGQTTTIDPQGSPAAQTQAYDGVMQDRRTTSGNTTMDYGFAGLTTQSTSGTGAHGEMFIRDPAGTLLATINTTNPANPSLGRYYLTDDQQSVMATINPAGTNAHRYLYEPYGEQIRTWEDTNAGTSTSIGTEATAAAPTTDHNPWRYASGYLDRDTGLIKFGTRYYVPQVASWTQRDPKMGTVDNPQTLNAYGYAGSNPVMQTDVSGRDWTDAFDDFGRVFGPITDAQDVLEDALMGDWDSVTYTLAGVLVGTAAGGACVLLSAGTGSIGCTIFGAAAGFVTTSALEKYDPI